MALSSACAMHALPQDWGQCPTRQQHAIQLTAAHGLVFGQICRSYGATLVRTACCARSDNAVQLMSRPSRWRSDAKATLLAVSSVRTVLRVSSVCDHHNCPQPRLHGKPRREFFESASRRRRTVAIWDRCRIAIRSPTALWQKRHDGALPELDARSIWDHRH